MNKFSLDALRSYLQEVPKGMIFDSLIAVEIGVEDYAISWEVHQDYLQSEDPKMMESLELASVGYLVELGMMLNVEEVDFDKILETANGT